MSNTGTLEFEYVDGKLTAYAIMIEDIYNALDLCLSIIKEHHAGMQKRITELKVLDLDSYPLKFQEQMKARGIPPEQWG